jgi:hypothetical protein
MTEYGMLAVAYGWLAGHGLFAAFVMMVFSSAQGRTFPVRACAMLLAFLVLLGIATSGYALRRYGALEAMDEISFVVMFAVVALVLSLSGYRLALRHRQRVV